MRSDQLEHPHVDRLSAFALGRLEDAEIDAMESHLSGCDTCCENLRRIQADSFVGVLQDCRVGELADIEKTQAGEPVTIAPASTDQQFVVQPAASLTAVHHASITQNQLDLPAELADHPRYRILELLGKGGMGAVYKAEHRLMHRTVALKVINPQLVSSKSAVERFQREVQAAARLHHPNIVTAHDAEQAGDVHFLVMEYVPGTDLHELLEERGPLPVAEACDYVRQAARALQHAMDHGMVHRDIKPQNLMLTDADTPTRRASEGAGEPSLARRVGVGTIKILDFGLASLTSETVAADSVASAITTMPGPGLTQAGSLMGTPDYMAPEQARDAHSADIRADIYSLGCTLYCLLTGKVPYPGGSAMDKVLAHAERRPQPISELRQDLPSSLVDVLSKMMAKDPDERFQTPAEVATALAPFAISLAAPRTKETRFLQETGFLRRPRRLVAALIAAAALLLAAGVIFYIVTDHGTIEIRTEDENVKIIAERNGKTITLEDLKSKQAWVVDTGKWTVRLAGNPDGLHIEMPRTFTLKRGGTHVVTIKRVQRPDLSDAAKKAFSEWQGAWEAAVASPGVAGNDTLTIDGDRWTTTYGPGRSRTRQGTFHIVGIKDGVAYVDKIVDKAGDAPEAKGTIVRAIFKLENETLYYCGTFGAQRPTTFVKGKVDPVYIEWKRVKKAETVKGPELAKGEVRRFIGHGPNSPIWSVAVTADGRRAASGCSCGTIHIWDVQGGWEVRQVRGHTFKVEGLAFTADGRRLVSASADGSVRVWEVDTAKELHRYDFAGGFTSVALSPDGRQALVGAHSDANVRLLDVDTGKEIRQFKGHRARVTDVAFSPDGRRAVSASDDQTLRLWDVNTGEELCRFDGHKGNVWGVAFAPDGLHIVSGGDDGILRLWNADTGKVRHLTGHTGGIVPVAFTPDGRSVITGSGGNTVRLWDVETGQELHRFEGHTRWVEQVAVLRDGRHVLSASNDGSVRLWRLPERPAPQIVEVWRHPNGGAHLYNVAISPDNRHWLAGGDSPSAAGHCVRVGELATGKQLREHRQHSMGSFTPDGKHHFTFGGFNDRQLGPDAFLLLRDTATGEVVRKFEGHTDKVWSAQLSPDGKYVLSGSMDKTLRLWDFATAKEIGKFEGHTEWCEGIFAPDGDEILSWGLDKTLRLWNLKTRQQTKLFEESDKGVFDACFLPGGKQIATFGFVDWDRTVRIWDRATGKLVRAISLGDDLVQSSAYLAWHAESGRFLTSHRDRTLRLRDLGSGEELHRFELKDTGNQSCNGVAISADGRFAFTSSFRQFIHLLRLPDPPPPGEIRRFLGHTGQVYGVAYASHGRYALSGGHDWSARLWDVHTGKEIRRFTKHTSTVWTVALSADGRRALTGSQDSTVRLWDVETGDELHCLKGHPPPFVLSSVVFSPDGKKGLSAAWDRTIKVWDLENGKELHSYRHALVATRLAFLPDGRHALSGHFDGSVRLWEVDTGKEIRSFQGHTKCIFGLALSADGRRALTGSPEDKSVRLWNVETGEELRRFDDILIHDLALSPDGRRALGCCVDNTIRLWDLTTGKELQRFEGHTAAVYRVEFSADGRQAISASADGTLRLWRLPETGQK